MLDAGAWIAIERADPRVRRLLDQAKRAGIALVTSAGVVAQIWRGGTGSQTPVALVLARTEVVPIDLMLARRIGLLLGHTRTADPIDAHIVVLAVTRGWPVLTSDPDDLLAIDPTLTVEHV